MNETPQARIIEVLQKIGPADQSGMEELATIWDRNAYIQCRRAADGGTRCEAAGTLMQPSLRHVLTPERIGRIEALGWVLDPSFGNYVRVFPAGRPVPEIADAILAALDAGYGVGPAGLFSKNSRIKSEQCPPRNGYAQNLAGMMTNAPEMSEVMNHGCAYVPTPDLSPPLPELGEPKASTDEVIARFAARVTRELDQLQARMEASDEDNWVFLVLDSGPVGYIQCEADPDAKLFYCEAQSAENWAALGPHLTPTRVAVLHEAGFQDPGLKQNYTRDFKPGPAENAAMAKTLLTILHDVYGFDGSRPLTIATESGQIQVP